MVGDGFFRKIGTKPFSKVAVGLGPNRVALPVGILRAEPMVFSMRSVASEHATFIPLRASEETRAEEDIGANTPVGIEWKDSIESLPLEA